MAHGENNTVRTIGELLSGLKSNPVTSAEQVWDYSQLDANNKPKTQEQINAAALAKQDALVSGTNIKTINGDSILGDGNLVVGGGGAVSSVNSKTGAVVLNASDVGAMTQTQGDQRYVQKESGKGLSTNDFTDWEKEQVENISDKNYASGKDSGMGRIVLKRNQSLQSQMVQTNTIYVVQDDLKIGGGSILLKSSNSMTIGGVTYFYGEVVLATGETINVTSPTKIFAQNSGYQWIDQGTSYTAASDVTVRLSVVGYTTNKIDYTFTGATSVTVPANCVLEFDGGSISGGTLVGNGTVVDASDYNIFKTSTSTYRGYLTQNGGYGYVSSTTGVILDGTWENKSVGSNWCGLNNYSTDECSQAINNHLLLYAEDVEATLPGNTYYIYGRIHLRKYTDLSRCKFINIADFSSVQNNSLPIPSGTTAIPLRSLYGLFHYNYDGGYLKNLDVDCNCTGRNETYSTFNNVGVVGGLDLVWSKNCLLQNIMVRNCVQCAYVSGGIKNDVFDNVGFENAGEHGFYLHIAASSTEAEQNYLYFRNSTYVDYSNDDSIIAVRGASACLKFAGIDDWMPQNPSESQKLRITNYANTIIEFDNCTFKRTNSRNARYFYGPTPLNIKFKNCYFERSASYNYSGEVASYMENSVYSDQTVFGSLSFEGCTGAHVNPAPGQLVKCDVYLTECKNIPFTMQLRKAVNTQFYINNYGLTYTLSNSENAYEYVGCTINVKDNRTGLTFNCSSDSKILFDNCNLNFILEDYSLRSGTFVTVNGASELKIKGGVISSNWLKWFNLTNTNLIIDGSLLDFQENIIYTPIDSNNTVTATIKDVHLSTKQPASSVALVDSSSIGSFTVTTTNDKEYFSASNEWRQTLRRGASSQRPSSVPYDGYEYYDTTLNRPIWYTGGMWTGADGESLSNNIATYGVIAERPPLDSINAGFMYTCIHTFQIDGTTYPTGTYIYDTPLADDGMWITPDGATLYDSQMPERELHVIATYSSTDFQLETLNEDSGLWATTHNSYYYSAFVDLSGFGRGVINLTYSGAALLMDHFPEVGEDYNSSYISRYTNTDEEEITFSSGVKYLVLISQGGNGGGTVEIMSARNKSQLASYNASDMSRSFSNPNGQYLVLDNIPEAWVYRQNNDNYATGYLDISSYVGKMANITYTSSLAGLHDVVFMADYPTNGELYAGSYISKISVPNGYDIQIPANAKYVFFVHLDRHASYGTANITIYELV